MQVEGRVTPGAHGLPTHVALHQRHVAKLERGPIDVEEGVRGLDALHDDATAGDPDLAARVQGEARLQRHGRGQVLGHEHTVDAQGVNA